MLPNFKKRNINMSKCQNVKMPKCQKMDFLFDFDKEYNKEFSG
jgi:hypothetical protein